MELRYIDAHSHVHFPQFDEDREDVLRRMKDAGVSTITVGCDRATSFAARDFAHEYGMYATAGLHPSDNRAEPLDEDGIRELLKDERVVAVGECGLDYSRGADEEEKERQKDIFRRQLALAREAGKPVMIHCRASGKDSEQNTDAHEDCIAILKEFGGVRPILHFFTGSPDIARRYLELGAYISLSGVVTFAPMYEAMVASLPLDRILVETDAPYAAPVPHRGKRNEPVFVIDTLRHTAKIRGEDEGVFAAQILSNVQRAFLE